MCLSFLIICNDKPAENLMAIFKTIIFIEIDHAVVSVGYINKNVSDLRYAAKPTHCLIT